MEKQQTVVNSAEYSGIALHSGARSTVRVSPAPENSGIVFRRVDLPGKPEVRALASNVADVRRGTTIGNGNAVVATVEHIMSALHAFHIDNCIVDMDGMEPPIGDGSALPYCQMLRQAGIVQQNAEAKVFTPAAPLYVEGGHTRLVIVPGEVLRIACTTSFPGCPIDPQFYEYSASTSEAYEKEVAGGRTFVNFSDLQQLLAMGLVKGGSLDAAAIIHDGAIICKEELRYPNEIVRHKILDLIGDIYLAGCRITGTIIAIKPGHPKNVELAGLLQKEIMTRASNKEECNG
ncbi:MAG: UDP-3-O-acyl-N-acetylglucosamine deacetylase [Victivallales bacterium]|nr:UDP-3-O-acyl-N-acetylglucosamine deacetylase [Victivallales bacterium]